MSRLVDAIQTLNIRELWRQLQELKDRMATNDELISRLQVATDKIAAKLAELSQGDPRFEPLISELEAMGADPANPVPGDHGSADDSGTPAS